jgi:hypothetical protein
VRHRNDLIENSLDVEWSGAVAKNAQIVLVASYPASASDDNLYDSESYIVNNVTARIMNVSYGECELGNGHGGKRSVLQSCGKPLSLRASPYLSHRVTPVLSELRSRWGFVLRCALSGGRRPLCQRACIDSI